LEDELHDSFVKMKRKDHMWTLNLPAREAAVRVQPSGRATQRRLVEACSCLALLALERADRQDPGFGKSLEERIIWRELLELELQEIDEKIGRISDEAGSGLN
jgi:hypothetical protein